MKIAYCIQSTFNSGGMERVLCNKSSWLAEKAGHEVSIITTDQQNRSSFFDFSKRIACYDLNINYSDIQGKSIFLKTLAYLHKQRLHKQRLAALLTELKADIVISMFGPEVGFLYTMKDGSRKVAEIHFSRHFRMQQKRNRLWKLADWWRTRQDQRYIRHYDRFVVLTHEDREEWGNGSNIEVIHNAATFVPTLAGRAASGDKRVISVGRLTFQKGYDMLLDAWQKVHERHPEWKLTLIGEGEEESALRQQIATLELTEVCELLPPTSQIDQAYRDGSIYVLSSRYEGLPMVLLEAMAAGVPVVAFACKCGPRDVITSEEDGLLIPPDDVVKLAEGICRLIENPELRVRLGEQGAETIRNRFCEERIMQQWSALFNSLRKSS